MIRRLIRSSLARDERGVTIVEFAFVAPVMMLMIMGFFDLAHRSYAQAVLQGAVQKAARDATLETGQTAGTAIDTKIETQMDRVLGDEATYVSKRLSYTNFSDVGDDEIYVDKAPKNGKYNLGECFEDINGNGKWDDDLGKDGQGSAQDAVLYRMTVTYPRLLPLGSMLGWTDDQTISASTVLRNQPYGDQVIPSVTKCPK